jgi:hypothetical protein
MSALASPALQTSRKKTGKKPAIMTVAKAELAQSYRAHETTARRSPPDSRPLIAFDPAVVGSAPASIGQ